MLSSKRFVGGVLAAAAMISFTAVADDDKKATVKVVNDSDWAIDHFHMSPVNEDKWGPDQLGADIIKKGGSFTLKDIPCDKYDVKLIDEDGDACVVEDVDVCGGNETWTITSKDLVKCQNDTEED